MIAAFDKVGYPDSMDAASIMIEFENILKQLSKEELGKYTRNNGSIIKYWGI